MNADCACTPTLSNHASLRVRAMFFGGILLGNSILARMVYPHNAFASSLSTILGVIVLSLPIFLSAIQDIWKGRFYMNELVALALFAGLVKGAYHEVGIIAFFMLIAIMIEEKTAIGAQEAIRALMRLAPVKARRIKNGQEENILAKELGVGDVLRVRPGENFPADGVVTKGESTVNQASITGESFPIDITENSPVFSGTENLTSLIEIKVTAIGLESTLGKVQTLIEQAEKTRFPMMRLADRYLVYYTPVILMITGVVWFFSQDLLQVVLILVIACPCALIVSTPSAIVAALAAGAREGIFIKNAAHIEIAATIKAIVFDKTGTLTTGELEVAHFHPEDSVELTELLSCTMIAESHSNHPIAHALRKVAKEANVTWKNPDQVTEYAGKGVIATSENTKIYSGRKSWFLEQKKPLPTDADISEEAMSVIYVMKEERYLGWIGFRDTIRSSARDAINALHCLGIQACSMVTGDNASVAKEVAEKLGIKQIQSECLPEDKVRYIKKLRQSGYVVGVVGDGVNDAPALASGDIGIAMGAIGSDIAINSASIALMNNDLRKIPFLIHLSRKTRRTIMINIALGLCTIIGGLILFIFGQESLSFFAKAIGWNSSSLQAFLAALIHIAGTLMVFFNSARLIRLNESSILPKTGDVSL